MGIRDFHIKLKAFRVRRFFSRNGGRKKNHGANKPSWMVPITHGHHVVEHDVIKGEFDSVVVQREQIDDTEFWYFGIFDAQIGDGVTKYLQSHFFDKKLKESHMRRKIKETLKRAYIDIGAKTKTGSTSVMVINGQKLVIANMGDYRTVLCRDGKAYQKSGRYNQPAANRNWYRKLFSGKKQHYCKGSEVVVGGDWIDSDTEFMILASNGIWEVMKNEEAVNLIRHIEDPEEAAECLAKEAVIRMSKTSISCLIVRFD